MTCGAVRGAAARAAAAGTAAEGGGGGRDGGREGERADQGGGECLGRGHARQPGRGAGPQGGDDFRGEAEGEHEPGQPEGTGHDLEEGGPGERCHQRGVHLGPAGNLAWQRPAGVVDQPGRDGAGESGQGADRGGAPDAPAGPRRDAPWPAAGHHRVRLAACRAAMPAGPQPAATWLSRARWRAVMAGWPGWRACPAGPGGPGAGQGRPGGEAAREAPPTRRRADPVPAEGTAAGSPPPG